METEEVDLEQNNVKLERSDLDNEIQIIPVQLIQSSSNVGPLSPRGKYYKQTYRPAWEHMPDFKGWLRAVEGEPTRAFCTYCHKTLHAHRLSLLKHTCTIRHQKAAQLHNIRKNKMLDMDLKNTIGNEDEEGEASNEGENEIYNEDDDDGDDSAVQINEVTVAVGDNTMDFQKLNGDRPPISTEVTDMTKGKPIAGLQVSLYKLIDGRWTFMNEGVTNSAGKFSQFINRSDFSTGRYKLHYDVDRYFDAKKQDSIYPFIEIVFDAGIFTETHHIPLLLSPYGYTTYRGS